MATTITISHDGDFELNGRSYHIPVEFSQREIFSYKRLLEPIPDIPGGTRLSREQRVRQHSYFLRRAVACLIPGLQLKALKEIPDRKVDAIHRWLHENRPTLAAAYQEVRS